MYGDLMKVSEAPSREGYTYIGWYTDPACNERWDMKTDTVESDMNLYAGWQKDE